MAKRILVPLDRTPEAEGLVPFIRDAASAAGATVRLVHIARRPDNVLDDQGHVIAYADQEITRLLMEGSEYLQGIAAQLDPVPTECEVRFGAPARQILAEAAEFEADLIAVTTTRRNAVGRLLLGSVAEEVFRRATVDVLLFRAA